MELTDAQRQYAADWVSKVFAPELDKAAIPEDLLILVFRDLSRQEEVEHEIRDRWGNWQWPYPQPARDGTLQMPRVDVAIRRWAKSCGVTGRTSLWPDNKPFAICLTHDVDFTSRRRTSLGFIAELMRRYWKSERVRSKLFTRQLLRHLAKYLAGPLIRFRHKDEYHCFDFCMELEAQFGFKSTFFFYAEHLPLPHHWDGGYGHTEPVEFYGSRTTVREMMHQMQERQWDVGLHGSYFSATDLPALMSEKQQLKHSAGVSISAIRHHYLHYDARMTPALHEQAGFKVDSTVGFNHNVGFRSGTSFPHYCWDHEQNRSTNVLEVPLHIMDGSLFSEQNLNCGADMAAQYAKMMVDRVAAVGGCLTINWHPCWLSLRPYREAYELILRNVYERNAWGCSIADVYRHWLTKVPASH